MRRVILDRPAVTDREVGFGWRVDPPSELYSRESFNLQFDGELSPREVPDDIWWTIALLCLHSHWALLRPCRVELPVELAPGEREFWLRLIDSAVETLERTWGGHDVARSVELVDRGPRAEPVTGPRGDRVALAFSGGKDSLASLGMLLEFGERPLAVTTTSPMSALVDHDSPRRWSTLKAVADRADTEHVEVHSNLRECWDNTFAHQRGYEVSLNELTDTHLYLSAALAIGWSRGVERIVLASEADVQLTTDSDGVVVQHPHFMYSAVTQLALSRLFARRGITYGSLTYPVLGAQVGRILWDRYPELRELQYSCWRHGVGETACNACSDCLKLALNAVGAGVDPARAGLDANVLFERMADWEPQLGGGDLADDRGRRAAHGAVVRSLAAMPPRRFAARLLRADPRRITRRETRTIVRNYARLQSRVAPRAAEVPDPGYRHSWLALVDERWRDRLEALLDSQFDRVPASEDRPEVERAQRLIGRITEPLGSAA